MWIARAAMIGIFGVLATELAGCVDERAELWRKMTDAVRVFSTTVPCGEENPASLAVGNQTYYEMIGSQWWINDPWRGTIWQSLGD